MSEWDYLPTPYETMIEEEKEHTILMFLSQCSLMEGKVLTPLEIIENPKFRPAIEELINRMTMTEFMRTMLKYENTRGHENKERIIKIIKGYVRRSRKKNI